MSVDRREFLKVAGLSALIGVGGAGAFQLLKPGSLEAAEVKLYPGELVGKRWGMVVDMFKFTPDTLKAAIHACNSIHNVPEFHDKQNIKWIWTAPYINTFPEVENPMANTEVQNMDFIVMCNHCNNPPCVRVCPTQATFQRSDGIVMMDMHRCIGCRFCMAACPYGSRSFNFRDPRVYFDKPENKGKLNYAYPTRMKGVVEKCTFCSERLEVGQLPACAEASGGAMVFGDMADPGSAPRQILRKRYSIRRKPNLGTNPQVYYLV